MKFEIQNNQLHGKLKSLEGLSKVLHDLDANEDHVSTEPAERAVLPYGGPTRTTSGKWKQS